jgi:hypothetical protein
MMPVDITGPVTDILKEVEADYITNDFAPTPDEDDEATSKFTASSWRKSKKAKKALAQFKNAINNADELPEDDVEEDDDATEEDEEPQGKKSRKSRKSRKASDLDEDDVEEDGEPTDEDDEVKEETDEPWPFSKRSKKARKARKASDAPADESDEIEEDDDKGLPPQVIASLDDIIDEFIDELDELPEDEKEELRDNFKKSSAKRASKTKVDDFMDTPKAKKALAKLAKRCAELTDEDELTERVKNSDPDEETVDEDETEIEEDDPISPKMFNDIINFVKENPDILDEAEEDICPVCGDKECSCDVEEDDDELFGKKSKKSRKASDVDEDETDEDETDEDETDEDEDPFGKKSKKSRKNSSDLEEDETDEDETDEDEDPFGKKSKKSRKSRKASDVDEDETDEDETDEDEDLNEDEDETAEEKLKRAAYNARRRAKRRAEKQAAARFNQWKNAWKAKCSDDDLVKEDDLEKEIAKAAKARAQAVKEAFKETVQLSSGFGSLTESETRQFVKTASALVNKFINESVGLIKKDSRSAAERHISKVVIPRFEGKISEYFDKVMRPELYEQFEGYMNYVVKHLFRELQERKLVVRSKQTENLTEFTDDLLRLIKKKLQIVPEREDALDAYENKVRKLTEFLQEEKVRTVKTRDKLIEAEKELWILKNIPEELSESKKDNLKLALSNIDESLDFDRFIVRATKLINEISASSYVSMPQPAQPKGHQKNTPSIDDFINKASELF